MRHNLKISICIFWMTCIAAGRGSAYGYAVSNAYSLPPHRDYFEVKPYSFSYKVRDPKSFNDYGHEERSDGHMIRGSYHVLLPDGRTQSVTYTADHNGYFPTIKYYGEAKYPYSPPPPKPVPKSVPPVSYPIADTRPYPSTSSAYRTPYEHLSTYSDYSRAPLVTEPPIYRPYSGNSPASHLKKANDLPSYVVAPSAPTAPPSPSSLLPAASPASSPAYREFHQNNAPIYVVQSQVYQAPRYENVQPYSTHSDNNPVASSYYHPSSLVPTLNYPLTATPAVTHYPNCPAAKHYHISYY